ncbi:unnamed protein product [marine sediment metagenome]|uniref:Uncharacterized protein n=1 Tax=marine sediment metagenome TaxID=412755 RepID=X0YJT9_9ZZZZ
MNSVERANLEYERAKLRLKESRTALKETRAQLKRIRLEEKKVNKQIRRLNREIKQLDEPEEPEEITLYTLKEQLDSVSDSQIRIERTLGQMTLGRPVQSYSPSREIPDMVPSTRPKKKPSELVLEIKTNPLFAKRVAASKNW